jgi:hypothetical protein
MVRSSHQIAENRLESLRAQKREIEARIAVTRAQLAEERHRYDALARHWQSIGPAAVLTPEEWHADRLRGPRAFRRGFLIGSAIPLAIALLTLLAS